MTSDAILSLLNRAMRTAQAGEPLAPALRLEGKLRQSVADALDQGTSLSDALARHVPKPVRLLLSDQRPPLHESLLLASTWLHDRRQRRGRIIQTIAYPLLSLALIAVVLIRASEPLGLDLKHLPWLLAAIPFALVPALVALPGPLSWRGTLRRAHAWDCAALVRRHRIPDAPAETIVGPDWQTIRGCLGSRDAEDHCQRMAIIDRRRAERRLQLLILVAVSGITVISGTILFHAAAQTCTDFLQRMEEVAFADLDAELVDP